MRIICQVERTSTRRVAIDAQIASIARRQSGLITRRQLLGEIGLRPGAVDRRRAAGQLVAVHRGVYRIGGHTLPLSWAMAAALAGGAGTVVSGHSAAAVHGIGVRGRLVEITAPGERRHPGIECHLASLRPDDVTVHRGVPVTTMARTVFDIADRTDAGLTELVHRARLQRPRLLAEVELLIARARGPGSRLVELRLRPHLTEGDGPVRSVFEQEFRRALARSDLPPAQFNVRVRGVEVDVLWSEASLVVELDGYAYHSNAAAFERDRERDAQLGAVGHQVVRITWRRWHERPDIEMRRLRAIIHSRITL